MMGYRASLPDPDRPKYWPGEEHHYRSDFNVGDVVRINEGSGYLGRITAFNGTHSHMRAGRLVHVEALVVYPGGESPEGARPYHKNERAFWENALAQAKPGDVAAHQVGEPGRHRHVPASWRDLS